MERKSINTANAPTAIGSYSQAIRIGDTVYLSGQVPLVPETMEMLDDDIDACIHQVFKNLKAVCEAAGGSLDNIVKLNVFLTDLACFDSVNQIMAAYFSKPYPARAAVGVTALPKGAEVEMDAVLVL